MLKFLAFSSRVLGVLLIVCSFNAPAFAADKLYSQTIAIPPEAGAALKTAADDAAQTLQKMTGQAFAVKQEYTDLGIALVRSTSPLAPADVKQQLAGTGREPFVIRSSQNSQLMIIANRDEGLSHGLYYYLEQLGVRFYFPSDNWTLIPKRSDITLQIDRLMVPEFKVRNFAGTGGLGGTLPVDAKRGMQSRWDLWRLRNRFGGEFTGWGHTGEAFNKKYKTLLLQHPEYLAKVDGKHVPWSIGAKLNTANPDAVALYVKDRLETFPRLRQADPEDPNSIMLSAEPSDGGGDCNSPECKAMGNGSPSDQVFYVANQLAKAVAKQFPGARVSLLAYNKHASVPSIPLEPNIYVKVTPYAFHFPTTGLTPVELIESWRKKIKGGMAIYDYWAITDWGLNQPNFNYLRTPREKLELWKANGVNAFTSESTYSSGAMGLAWYMSSRLMWDLKTDENEIIREFYQKSFGRAAPPMQNMMERWANGFVLTDQEIALSFRDLQAAVKLAESAEERSRVADFSRYVQYLRLRLEWQNAAKGEAKEAAANLLARHMWSIYDSAMIHTYRLFKLLTREDQPLRDAYKYSDNDAPGWKDVKPVTDAEARHFIDLGLQDYKPLDFVERKFSGPVVPLQIASGQPASPQPVTMTFMYSAAFDFQAPPGMKELRLKVAPTTDVRLLLSNAAGDNILDRTVNAKPAGAANPWTELQIPLPAPGNYSLEGRSPRARFGLEIPTGVAFSTRRWQNSTGQPAPRMYFYVPKGLKTLAIHFTYQMVPRFYDSSDKEVLPREKKAPGIVLMDVPAGQDGKVWSMLEVRTPRAMTMLNAPQNFGFYPDAMMVPQDALK